MVRGVHAILSSDPSSTSTSGEDEVIGTGVNPPPKTTKNLDKINFKND